VTVPVDALREAVRWLQSGRPDEAERILTGLRRSFPHDPDAIALLGLAHAQQGRNEPAAALMAEALTLNPSHVATLVNHAKVLSKLSRWDEAADAASRALAIRHDHTEARRLRAHALAALDRAAEALADLDAIATNNIDTLALRAKLRFAAARTNDALTDYDSIVALDPGNWEALNNRGIALDFARRFEEAATSYARALALRPDDNDVIHNRGANLIALQRYDEAYPLFERLVRADPDRADNWSCHGAALTGLLRFDDAIASFNHALKLDPASLRALNGRGMVLAALQRTSEALSDYRAAITVESDNAMTHANLAFTLLASGDLRDGFAEYEWRRKAGAVGRAQRTYPQPEWQGEDIAGKTLLLHPEQGLGDIVQFARFAPLLAQRGIRVVLETLPGLETLLRTLEGAPTIISLGQTPPQFDVHAPLMSLGHKLGITLQTIPANVPYLHASEPQRAVWRERLSPLRGRRVGLCWSGNKAHFNDRARSIALERLGALFDVPGVSFVSLQREVRETDHATLKATTAINDFTARLTDFADTAAMIAERDLVITVDTSVAHVACALGKPTWILLAKASDWRWLVDREDSPWYPTARLFRQTKIGHWEDVIGRVRDALLSRA
jgi:tetratricopeptide (TPR) repeat protein